MFTHVVNVDSCMHASMDVFMFIVSDQKPIKRRPLISIFPPSKTPWSIVFNHTATDWMRLATRSSVRWTKERRNSSVNGMWNWTTACQMWCVTCSHLNIQEKNRKSEDQTMRVSKSWNQKNRCFELMLKSWRRRKWRSCWNWKKKESKSWLNWWRRVMSKWWRLWSHM